MVAEGLATAIASWATAGDEGGSLSTMVIVLAFVVFCVAEMKFSKPPGVSEMLHRTKSF